jgi:HlyD family secretion protein
MTTPDRNRRTWNMRRPLALGLAALLLLGGVLGVWAVRANIAGAVIGQGVIEVSSTMTAVQHPIGGVVAEILVRDGDPVRAGDVVVRLDDRQLLSDLKVVESDLYEALANIARLEAAIEGRSEMILHPLLAEAADQPEIAALLDRQRRQLDAHFAANRAAEGLLDEQIAQIGAQIEGVEAQLAAKSDEAALVGQELVKARDLNAKGLIKFSELLALEKAEVAIRGETGRLTAQIAELRGKIAESELKRHSIAPDAAERLVPELTRLRPERTRFLERRASLLESLSRLEITAPVSGRIYDNKVLGLRSVVVAASPLMMIVPDDVPVQANVRVFATDIDQVFPGQEASLKFKAFNGRQIPIILGRVAQVSADSFLDQRTQKNYYEVKVALLPEELAKLGDHDLIPGMPVEAFMSTESRTPLNYVLRPILFYFDRAFRDA